MNGTGIIYMDDPNQITQALFYTPKQPMIEYLTQSVQNYVDAVGVAAPKFAAAIKERFRDITSSAAVQYAKTIKNRINSLWDTDTIKFLKDTGHIQQAPNCMKRYVMAHPGLRSRYDIDGISAYDNTYIDEYPKVKGTAHYDYRRVVDGIIMQDNEGNVGYRVFVEHVETIDLLDLAQKCSILATWDIIDDCLEKNDRDPTSPWNGKL